MRLCASGHRPDKLGGYSSFAVARVIEQAMMGLVQHWPSEVIVGMALGWDQAVAEACLALKIPYIAAIPFEGQDRLWPAQSQDRFRFLRSKAASEVIICPGGYEVAKMQHRNEWMVDNSDAVLAMWNGTSGGTANCLTYARLRGKPVFNMWQR